MAMVVTNEGVQRIIADDSGYRDTWLQLEILEAVRDGFRGWLDVQLTPEDGGVNRDAVRRNGRNPTWSLCTSYDLRNDACLNRVPGP